MADYALPVSKLLELGQPSFGQPWMNYRELDLGPAQVADLIRMATDRDLHAGDPESPEVYAPIHAWRALGQIKAAEALPALLGYLDGSDEDDEWGFSDLSWVFADFGPGVIPALSAFVNDPDRDTYVRWTVVDAIAEIGTRFPEVRAACIDGLVQPLTTTIDVDPEVNAAAIIGLLKLKAVEAAPLIEMAFEAGRVDETIIGDWPTVRFELGLGPEPPPRQRPFLSLPPNGDRSPRSKAEDRKAKRKRERQARKRSRKRR